jgi:hypothetical protein
MTTPRERAKHMSGLRSMATNFTAAAEGHEEEDELSQAVLWQVRADALCWALRELDPGYMPRTWPEIMQKVEPPSLCARQAMEEDG